MPSSALPLLATSELVACAWIGSIDGLSPQMTATTLPPNDAAWAPTGFVTVSVVGGSPDIYNPVKKPVMQIDCYATRPGSNKPPWGQANVIAETIRYATLQRTGFNRELSLSANGVSYPSAAVQSAYLMTEMRRMYSDAADYAHYSFDMQMTWITIGDHIF